jgi:hypothetical protein
MRAAVDYRDGRDAVSGEPVSLIIPRLEEPATFVGETMDDYLERQAEDAIAAETRLEDLRERRLTAAISTLKGLIADAEDGDGRAASKVEQAAASDLIIDLLATQLRAAKALIPLDSGAPEILRIDAALAAAGLA